VDVDIGGGIRNVPWVRWIWAPIVLSCLVVAGAAAGATHGNQCRLLHIKNLPELTDVVGKRMTCEETETAAARLYVKCDAFANRALRPRICKASVWLPHGKKTRRSRLWRFACVVGRSGHDEVCTGRNRNSRVIKELWYVIALNA
jgi:hypothetical protein